MSKKTPIYPASYFMKPTGSTRQSSSSGDDKRRSSVSTSESKKRRSQSKTHRDSGSAPDSPPIPQYYTSSHSARGGSRQRKSEPRKNVNVTSQVAAANIPVQSSASSAVSSSIPSASSISSTSAQLCPQVVRGPKIQTKKDQEIQAKLLQVFGPTSPSDASIVAETQSSRTVDDKMDSTPQEVDSSLPTDATIVETEMDISSKLIEELDSVMPTFLHESSFAQFSDTNQGNSDAASKLLTQLDSAFPNLDVLHFSDLESVDTQVLNEALGHITQEDVENFGDNLTSPGGMILVDEADCTEIDQGQHQVAVEESGTGAYQTPGGVIKARSLPPLYGDQVLNQPAELQVLGLMQLRKALEEERGKKDDQLRSLINLNQFLPELGNAKMMRKLNFANRADEDLAIRPTKSLIPRK
jgi:hypothetical protein